MSEVIERLIRVPVTLEQTEMSNRDKLEQEVHACSRCCHLLGNRTYSENWEGWKCAAKDNVVDKVINVVSGKIEPIHRFRSARMAREDNAGCSKAGKWWELYVPPVRVVEEESLSDVIAKAEKDAKKAVKSGKGISAEEL